MADKSFPAKSSATTPAKSSAADIDNFLAKASEIKAQSQGRLVFALDATMSRQPTWDRASSIQASMFTTAGNKSGLAVQLVYFRGYGESRASKWVTNPSALATLMTKIDCRGGTTQISKVLSHVSKEHTKKRVSALVFIGDAMEEDVDRLCNLAGKLGAMGVKAFMFQEGHDKIAESAFREIARLSNGAYMRFTEASIRELEELLSAVAAFATGGYQALENRKSKSARALLEQLKP